MEWYYAKGRVQQGPVDEETLKAAVRSGEVGPDDIVWRDGMRDWKPVRELAMLSCLLPAPAPPGPAGPPPLEAKSSPYQPPGAPPAPMPPAAGPPEGSGRSTASLVLGILGVFFSCIPCIGLILGILAVVYGGQVIDSARVRYELQPYVGTARAGKILGIVTIVLSVLATVSSFVSNRS